MAFARVYATAGEGSQTGAGVRAQQARGVRRDEDAMASLGWRLRLWASRLVPHTAAKRWAYGLALVLALAPLGLGRPLWTAVAVAVVVAVRLLDLVAGRRRFGRLSTEQAYFFEGHDQR